MLRRIRLGAGLALFVFVTSHLVNHAWGLASLDALDIARDVFVAVWRSWPGIIVLYGALLVHIALVLWTYSRRRKADFDEAARLALEDEPRTEKNNADTV